MCCCLGCGLGCAALASASVAAWLLLVFAQLVIVLGWKVSGAKLPCAGLWLNASKSEFELEATHAPAALLPTRSRGCPAPKIQIPMDILLEVEKCFQVPALCSYWKWVYTYISIHQSHISVCSKYLLTLFIQQRQIQYSKSILFCLVLLFLIYHAGYLTWTNISKYFTAMDVISWENCIMQLC